MFHLVQQRLGQWFPLAKPPGETQQAAAGLTVSPRGCWDYITSGNKQQNCTHTEFITFSGSFSRQNTLDRQWREVNLPSSDGHLHLLNTFNRVSASLIQREDEEDINYLGDEDIQVETDLVSCRRLSKIKTPCRTFPG